MSTETTVQTLVHKLEEGGWKPWIFRLLVCAFLAFMTYQWMFKEGNFKGLSEQFAMEQAQISREIARGNGFSTKMIRPAALYQLKENSVQFTLDRIPDAYHAPLNPYINAPFLLLAKNRWQMTNKEVDYVPDKIIASVQLAFMFLGWLMSYLTMRRLFDARLAAFGLWLMILCQSFWNYAVSGLPQGLMFFLFSTAIYFLVRAIQNRVEGQSARKWLLLCSFTFGLLALTHALTLWIFVGLLVFVLFYFPGGPKVEKEGEKPSLASRLINAPVQFMSAVLTALRVPESVQGYILRPAPFVMMAVVVLMYLPWMIHNQRASGNLVGLGWYSGLHQIKGSEPAIMRSMDPPFEKVSPNFFRNKIQSQINSQVSRLMEYMGGVLVAPVFLLALMHTFRRAETSHFRWAILSMWLFAILGMSVFGLQGKPVSQPFAAPVEANDLHLLFIPMLAAYGMAFILVMWARLEIHIKIFRWAFLFLIFFISGQQFLLSFLALLGQPQSRVQWPPYAPPFVAMLSQWTNEREIIASDMPWAVAWYADRRSIWLPIDIKTFFKLNDENMLDGRIVGLYLTPITGNRSFVGDILKGEYKDWAPFILRQLNVQSLKDFPLRAVTHLPMENECVFYADRDRWTVRED